MMSTKKMDGVEARGTKFWSVLLMVVHSYLRKGVFFPRYAKISYIYVDV